MARASESTGVAGDNGSLAMLLLAGALVGVSRLALNAHSISEVICGWLMGAAIRG